MENSIKFEVVELSQSECIEIKANGWLPTIIIVVGYIAEGWIDFKQGFADGFAAVEKY